MKVTNIRKKLAAALVAGGMLVPSAAHAADLDINLLIDPGFESVGTAGAYGAPLNSWTDGTLTGYTYFSAIYANGGALAGGGDYYFTSNASSDGDVTAAGEVAQVVDLSTGASGTLIASGNAAFGLSGFFSTYLTNNDFAFLQVDFKNSGNTTLSSKVVGPNANLQTWTQLATGGAIPVGTTSALVSVYGGGTDGGPDGYLDNIDFRVTDEVILSALDLRVDRDDGSLILSNRTGSPVNISGYQITSAFEGLNPATWQSIADNYDANSGSAVDGANIWTELTQTGAHGDLSEADLASGNGGSLAHTQSINLGNAGTWIRNHNEDLVFQYISNGSVVTGLVNFEDGAPFVEGDLNTDGIVNSSDWAILRSNQHTDLSGKSLAEAYLLGDMTGDLENNHADFVAFKNDFDAVNGLGAFQAMIATTVPEPTSVVLLMTSGLLLLTGTRRQR